MGFLIIMTYAGTRCSQIKDVVYIVARSAGADYCESFLYDIGKMLFTSDSRMALAFDTEAEAQLVAEALNQGSQTHRFNAVSWAPG